MWYIIPLIICLLGVIIERDREKRKKCEENVKKMIVSYLN